MSKIIYVYATAVQKCVHLRVSDAWFKKVKMALAIGCTLDGYCIDGSRIKRKNQRNISSVRGDSDEIFKGYDIFLNKQGVWEFKKYNPKALTGIGSGHWKSSPTAPQHLLSGYNPTQVIKDDLY